MKRWVLLDGSRYGVTFGVGTFVFVLFVWLGYSGTIGIGRGTTTSLYLFAALSTVLDAAFATRNNHSRWTRHANEPTLSAAQRDRLADLEERLTQLDIVR